MNILITGGLGFIGTQLSLRFLGRGYRVTVVDHSPQPRPYTPKEVNYVAADTAVPGAWQEEIQTQHAVINLAGTSIFTRWSKKTKQLIHDSRILTTRNVVEAIPAGRETLLCSTSAIGYYGFRHDEELTEADSPGSDFLARVCIDWEKEAGKAADKGARVVITRFGIVLGKTGGALGQMVPLFKMFAGGPQGSGRQWFSWIHMEDLLNAFVFVLDHKTLRGPVNLCSPKPVRNRDLAKALGEVLSRPSFLKTPSFMLRLVLGEFGSMILKGQRVIPARLLEHGFTFRYPEIIVALAEVLG
ncbi:MAG: TIGR01777 family oxidoreductase [Deltaproteobacteria bacterium]|nr:MAG: TIGR01777 family oxidoreductase [Deltaproteobacteria bacterium]